MQFDEKWASLKVHKGNIFHFWFWFDCQLDGKASFKMPAIDSQKKRKKERCLQLINIDGLRGIFVIWGSDCEFDWRRC